MPGFARKIEFVIHRHDFRERVFDSDHDTIRELPRAKAAKLPPQIGEGESITRTVAIEREQNGFVLRPRVAKRFGAVNFIQENSLDSH